MKILLLNPTIDAGHKISARLESAGIAILFPASAEEAFQILQLHGKSIDLGIFHKEGVGSQNQNSGLELISKIKADPNQSDLPIILTTELWTDEDCANHQDSNEGVNAYIRAPFSDDQLIEVIEEVLGQTLESIGKNDELFLDESAIGEATPPIDGPVLEDVSAVFMRPEAELSDGLSIQLEAPEISQSQVSIPTATTLTQNLLEELPTATINLETLVPTKSKISIPSEDQSNDASFELSQTLNLGNANESQLPSGDQQSVADALNPIDSALVDIESNQDQQADPSDDPQVLQEMPYLYSKSSGRLAPTSDPALLFAEPMGDAVVPGGAAESPDVDTLKKYLQLREKDVAVLSNQLKVLRDQLKLVDQTLKEEKAKNAELMHLAGEQKKKIEDFDREKSVQMESFQAEVNEIKFQLKVKTDKARVVEVQNQELTKEIEHLKERVRSDIRKIRIREKELENRLEIVKKDSEALISARENKIIELKRKLDLIEFNMDLLQDQYTREKENSAKLRERLGKVAQVVRVAGGMLDSNKPGEADLGGLESQSVAASEDGRKIS